MNKIKTESMTQNNTKICLKTLQELLDAIQDPIGRCNHLQIILRKNKNIRSRLDQKFLLLSPNGFGVYILKDVDYNNGVIIISLSNIATGNMAQIELHVDDQHPQVFLLNWNDFKNLVYIDCPFHNISDDLLELVND